MLYSLNTSLQELGFNDAFYAQNQLNETNSVYDLFVDISLLISNGEKDLLSVLSLRLKEYPQVLWIIERGRLIDVFYETKSSPDIS